MQEDVPNSLGARRLSKRTQWLLIAVAVVVVVLLVGLVFGVGRLFGSREPAPVAAAPASDHTFHPSKEQLAGLKVVAVEAHEFRGVRDTDGMIAVDDDTTTPVFSPYSGRVVRVLAKPGDIVKAGAPLMSVDASEFVQGENDLAAAHAAREAARSQLQVAEATEERQHALYLAKAGAQKDWQQSQADLSAAQTAFKTADVSLVAARNRLHILGRSEHDIDVMEGSAAGAASAEALVVAPIQGTVTQRQVGTGQYITSAAAGATNPVFSISDLNTVWLVANAREADAPLMHVGQAVEVRVLAIPGRVFKAKVTWIAPSVDPVTRRVAVRAVLPNPEGVLKPMMFATFSIVVGAAESRPGVPDSAVVYEGEEARVWVLRPDGALVLRPIKTGRAGDGLIEVVDGVAVGEKVVTSGALFIDRAASE